MTMSIEDETMGTYYLTPPICQQFPLISSLA